MSHKINALTQPVLNHQDGGNHGKAVTAFIQLAATKEVTSQVLACIMPEGGCGFRVLVAAQYAIADKWYPKESIFVLDLDEAVKKAYGLLRKNYHVTASRALAGLLHDSIVPATDDIDC